MRPRSSLSEAYERLRGESVMDEIRALLGRHLPGYEVTAPELLWPLWGGALGAATLAYYYRRRGKCEHCSRL